MTIQNNKNIVEQDAPQSSSISSPPPPLPQPSASTEESLFEYSHDEIPFAEAEVVVDPVKNDPLVGCDTVIPTAAATPLENPTTPPLTVIPPTTTTTTTTTTNYNVRPTGMGVAVPPGQTNSGPGRLPPGGKWITVEHIGNTTWGYCTVISVMCCILTCCPCGVWAFLCPCDTINAYEVNGKVYNESGQLLGDRRDMRVVG